MIDRVLQTVEQYHMFEEGDAVAVGVSGGADSVALLHCLATKLPQLQLRLVVCHVNHQLRGKESDRDMHFVETLCRELSLPCHVLSKDVAALAKESCLGVEECGRELRYRFFEETALRYGANTKIATAHTLSDQAETVLFRLARGTGLRGLGGIPPVRGRIVRPLIGVTREEVETYCAENGLSYVTDVTNRDVAYARNRIRHEVIPPLLQLNPSFLSTLGFETETFREDSDYLWETAAKRLCEADIEDGYDVYKLKKEPNALYRRMLLLILRENGVLAGREKTQQLDEIIRGKPGKISMAKNLFAEASGGVLRFFPLPESVPYFEIPFQTGKLTFPVGLTYNISVLPFRKGMEKVNRNFATDILDYDKILDNAVFRQRRSGDRLAMPRRGVAKSLKKLCSEEKVPLEKREMLAVLADSGGVLWVEGFGADSRALPGDGTKRCVIIQRANAEPKGKRV